MAQLQPLPIDCPVCGEELRIRLNTKPTSDKAPASPVAALFIEVDSTQLEDHIAGHLADLELAA